MHHGSLDKNISCLPLLCKIFEMEHSQWKVEDLRNLPRVPMRRWRSIRIKVWAEGATLHCYKCCTWDINSGVWVCHETSGAALHGQYQPWLDLLVEFNVVHDHHDVNSGLRRLLPSHSLRTSDSHPLLSLGQFPDFTYGSVTHSDIRFHCACSPYSFPINPQKIAREAFIGKGINRHIGFREILAWKVIHHNIQAPPERVQKDAGLN